MTNHDEKNELNELLSEVKELVSIICGSSPDRTVKGEIESLAFSIGHHPCVMNGVREVLPESDIVKHLNEFWSDFIAVLESNPEISDVTQFTNEFYEVRRLLKQDKQPAASSSENAPKGWYEMHLSDVKLNRQLQERIKELEAELQAVKTGKGIANPYLVKDRIIKQLRGEVEAANHWRDQARSWATDLNIEVMILRSENVALKEELAKRDLGKI